jgi:transposase-like protein
MKIVHTMASEALANRPRRRFYSPEFKTQVMQACRQSGASVVGVALSHGINANIVHRWLREQTPSALSVQSQAFVLVTLND